MVNYHMMIFHHQLWDHIIWWNIIMIILLKINVTFNHMMTFQHMMIFHHDMIWWLVLKGPAGQWGSRQEGVQKYLGNKTKVICANSKLEKNWGLGEVAWETVLRVWKRTRMSRLSTDWQTCEVSAIILWKKELAKKDLSMPINWSNALKWLCKRIPDFFAKWFIMVTFKAFARSVKLKS